MDWEKKTDTKRDEESQRNDDLIIEGTILDAVIEIKQGQAPYSVKSDIHLFYFIFLGMKYIRTSVKIKQS